MSYYKGKEYERDNYPSREYQPIPKKQALQIRNKQAFPTLEEKRREYHGRSNVNPRSNSISSSSQKSGHLQNLVLNVGRDNKRLDLQKFKVYKNMDPYDLGTQVGEGTYGQVFKAKSKSTGQFVALKKLYLKEDDKGKEKNRDGFPITGIREIEILRSLKHQNIVELQAMVSMSTGLDNMDMFMVFEYMDHDLTGILNNDAVVYRLPHIKCLSKQLFKGLEYLHSRKIIHRDIKGANLLLNNKGYLKIADFGLARRIHLDRDSGEPLQDFEYTNRVVTLWYRSPELLFGSCSYGFEVDLWSAGCILMEFYTRFAIFQGRTEFDQLEKIIKLCGSPNESNYPGFSELPWMGLISFPQTDRTLAKEFRDSNYGLTSEFVNLVDALLSLYPLSRPTASEALSHAYFEKEMPKACEISELPKIVGDWHEYEGKLRKKKGANLEPAKATSPERTPKVQKNPANSENVQIEYTRGHQSSVESQKDTLSRKRDLDSPDYKNSKPKRTGKLPGQVFDTWEFHASLLKK